MPAEEEKLGHRGSSATSNENTSGDDDTAAAVAAKKSRTGFHNGESSDAEKAAAGKDEKSGEADDEQEQDVVKSMSLLREVIFVGVVSLAQFSTQVGVGQTVALLHVIGADLDINSTSELSWLLAAYSLTVGAFILPAGRLGDVFGHKRMLLLGFSWFALWTMVAGLAVYSNHVLFDFARALQGIGPAICLPNALGVLGSLYKPGLRKNMVFAIFGSTAPVGSVLGATFGGLFALAWWPWAFWSFAIVLAAAAVVGELVIPTPPRKITGLTAAQKFWKLDPVGSVVGVTALVLIDFALNQAPLVGWASPYVIVCLVLGVLLVPAFFYLELRVVANPLLPLECLNNDMGLILACVSLGWSSFGIFLFYIWQFFELLRHASPLLASAWYSTNAVSGAGAAILTGLLLTRAGPSLSMVLAMLAYLTGSILLATMPIDQIYWLQAFFCLLIIPFGMDISFPAATVIVSNAVPKEHQGIGASLVNTVVNFSISLGLGFAGNAEVQYNDGGTSPEQLLRGYRAAYYTGVGLSGLGVIVSVIYWLKVRLQHKQE